MAIDTRVIHYLRQSVNIIHSPGTGWIILLVSLLLTFSAYHTSSTQMHIRVKERFDYRTSQLSAAIEERILMYEQSLWGAVGLFNSSKEVERQEWHSYVESLNLSERLPGIQGLGYAIPIKKNDLESVIHSIREEGFPDFTIKPDTPREEYTAILYLEPFDWRNQRAFGFDMWSNPIRREAMQRAKELGVAATSAMITLVQETDKDTQKGFLTYLPVYQKIRTPLAYDPTHEKHSNTEKPKYRQLQGWVYGAFRIKDLMHGIGTENLYQSNFSIYDGPDVNDQNILYHYISPTHSSTDPDAHMLTKEVPINFQGHRWTLVFSAPISSLLSSDEKHLPLFILTAGIIVDTLLFYVIISLFFVNRHAQKRESDAIEKNKITQRYLKEQKRFAREAKEQAQLYFELAPVAFIVSDQQGHILSANKMAHACFRSENNNLLDKTLRELFEQNVFPITEQQPLKPPSPCLQSFNDFTQENQAIRLDGERFPAHIQQVPIELDGNTLIASVIQDITEQHNTAQQMAEARQRAEQASQSKTEFVANMSHEIRTPMNAILGASQLLDKTKLNITQSRYNRMIRSSCELLHGIINDILDFSKIEAGHMHLEEVPFDLDELLSRISSMLTVIVGEKPLEVAIIVDPTIDKLVIGDPIRLQQIVINLLSNAVKFTPQGKITVRLESQPKEALANKALEPKDNNQQQHLRLCVTDSGIGMHHEQMDCLFKAFKQADGTITRRFGGSGLGLTITKSLTEMMGGTISVKSEINKGSSFELNFSIPRQNLDKVRYKPVHACFVIVIEPFAEHRQSLASIFEYWNWPHHCLDSLQSFEQWQTQESCQVDMIMIDSEILSTHFDQFNRTLLQKGLPENVLILAIASNHLQSELTLSNHTQIDAAVIRPAVPLSLLDALQAVKAHAPEKRLFHGEAENPLSIESSLKGIRILLVEDNEINQVITQEILQEYGIEVLIANNGQEALNMLEECQETIDLVLMDHHMPVMDGLTATLILRKEKSFKKPIIALTAGVMRSEQDEYLSAGMNAVVAKPIEAQILLASIKKAVA